MNFAENALMCLCGLPAATCDLFICVFVGTKSSSEDVVVFAFPIK